MSISKFINSTIICIALSILPVIFFFVYLKALAVNVIHADDFAMVKYIVDNSVDLKQYFLAHNNHIIFLSRIIYTCISKYTSYNIIYILFVSFILLSILYILLIKFNNSLEHDKCNDIIFSLLIGMIIYHPMQFSNFLWAFQLSFILCLFFSCLSLYFFQYMFVYYNNKILSIKYFILTMFCSFCATFSSSQGVTIWLTITFLWILYEKKLTFKNLTFYFWNAAAILSFNIYFLLGNPSQGVFYTLIYHPLDTFLYFLMFLGNYTHYLVFGFFIFLLSIALVIDFLHSKRKIDIFPISLIINSILVAASTAVSRADLGIDQANSSRYVGFSLLVPLGCFIYIHNNKNSAFFINKFRFLKNLDLRIIKIILLLSVIVTFSLGIHKSFSFSHFMSLNKFYLQTYDTQPNFFLKNIYENDVNYVREVGAMLKSKSLHVFHEYTDKLDEISNLPINKLNNHQNFIIFDEITYHNIFNDPFLLISGAAIDPDSKGTVDSIIIEFNEQKFLAYYGINNPVIKKLSRRSRYRLSGFSRAIPIRLLIEDEYDVKILLLNKSKDVLYETNVLFSVYLDKNNIKVIKVFDLN